MLRSSTCSISPLPKIILFLIQLSCYFHEKRFNSCVKVLCVNMSSTCRMSGWKLLKEMDRRRYAVSWRNTLWRIEEQKGQKERNVKEGCLLPSTNLIWWHLASRWGKFLNDRWFFRFNYLEWNIAINQMCIQSK